MFKTKQDLVKYQTSDALVEKRAQEELSGKRQGKSVLLNDKMIKARVDALNGGMKRTANTALMYDIPRRYDVRKYDKDLPKDREDLNRLCLLYFLREPVVNRGIRLAVEFPLSEFQLIHEDPGLEKLFNEISEDLNLSQLAIDLSYFYYIYGEAILFTLFDDPEKPTMIKEVDIFNPAYAEIVAHKAFTGREYEIVYFFHRDPYLYKLCMNPTSDFERMLANKIPADIYQAVRERQPYRLSPLQSTFFKRVGDPLSPRGQSVIYPALNALMYQDDLVQTQRAIMRRHVAPHEIYKVGTDAQPATREELDALYTAVQNTWQSGNNALIWHHALQVQIEGANGKILNMQPEYDWVEKQILYSLGIPKSFLSGDNIAYANASVALEVVISNWLAYRQALERIINQAIFEPICRMHKIYKKQGNDANSKYHIKFKNRPWLPTFNWDKQYLRRDDAKINLLQTIVDKGLLPTTVLQDALNYTDSQIFEGFKSQYSMQRKLDALKKQYGVKDQGNAEAGEGLPGLGGIGGGMGGGDLAGGLGGLGEGGDLENAGGAGGEFGVEGEGTEAGTKLPEASTGVGPAEGQIGGPGLPTAV